MDWDRIADNWKQFSGRVKEKWGKLTDDDLTAINERRDQLEGKIQERYGYAKDQVRKESMTGSPQSDRKLLAQAGAGVAPESCCQVCSGSERASRSIEECYAYVRTRSLHCLV